MYTKNIEKHRYWYDKRNYCITHFDMHTIMLPFSCISFDDFHCRLSIIRAIWNYVRTYVEGYGYDANENFGKH